MSTNMGPSQVLIIRHGEKVGNPKKDDDGGRNLSILGFARAAAVPSLFAPALSPPSCKLHIKSGAFVGLHRPNPLKRKPPQFSPPNFTLPTQYSNPHHPPSRSA